MEQSQQHFKENVKQERNVSPTRKISPTRRVSPTRGDNVSPTRRNIAPSGQQTTLVGQQQTLLNPQQPTLLNPLLQQQQQETIGYHGFKSYDFENIYNDPTIKVFNRFFTRDTHKLLGQSGVKVSRICLGTMNFGKLDPQFGERPGQLDESKACEILDRFVELGGNCIDTANFFPWFGKTSGESERIIGNWLSK